MKQMATKEKKKKGLKIFAIIMAFILAIVGMLALIFLVIMKEPEIETFDFSGYVYADGEALSGAKVSCGITSTETDENGYYSFSGLTSVVEVIVSKENYVFDSKLVTVGDDSENINFSGFEIYSISGVVRNGDEIVPFADIRVLSELGEYVTKSNAFGVFTLPRLAGEVDLIATHSSIQLFSQSFDKTKTDLVVSGMTSITGKITVDGIGLNDFRLTINGSPVTINYDLTFRIHNVTPDSELKLLSDSFHIENDLFVVTAENSNYDFVAEKYYSVNGIVRSGDTIIPNARIDVNNTKAYSNKYGKFSVENLYGPHVLKAAALGFEFENVSVDCSNCDIEMIGLFDLSGQIITDDNSFQNIRVLSGNQSVLTNALGRFTLENIELGDIVSIDTDDYHVVDNNQIVASKNEIKFELLKLYDLSVNVSCNHLSLVNAGVVLGDDEYNVDTDGNVTIVNLFGVVEYQVVCDGYRFEEKYICSYLNSNANIVGNKYFDVTGVVKTGNIVLSGANLTIGDNTIIANEYGEFEFCNQYSEGVLRVECNGYNSQFVQFDIENNNVEINLTYNVSGVVVNGSNRVDGVNVFIDENHQVITDYTGKFEFVDLTGENTIICTKDYYQFDTVKISACLDLYIESSYSIEGFVSNASGVLNGLKIILLDNSQEPITIETVTDDNGKYSFAGLEGEYLLMYDPDYTSNLLPNCYEIDRGGVYSFADCGYKIRGRVTSGGLAVEGVTVTAGDLVVTTNAQGIYKFDLIITDEILTLSKAGYEFENNNLPIDMSFDGREDVDFECSYKVSGTISSGEVALAGASVTVGEKQILTDENGYYEVCGIKGKVDVSAQLENYTITSKNNISSSSIVNLVATYSTKLVVKSGNLLIENVKVKINNRTYITNKLGEVEVSGIQIGDIAEFEKDGFDIVNHEFGEYSELVTIYSTYFVRGKVYLTSKAISGVKVTCGESVVFTDSSGGFDFSKLSGSNVISFEKDSLIFENVQIDGYCELSVSAFYSVSGTILVAGAPLENVKVSTSQVSVFTDINGYYYIQSLNDVETLVFEKIGYSFPADIIVSGPSINNVSASYSISGQVKTGDVPVANIQIDISNGTSVITDDNGFYQIDGIESVVSLEIKNSKYNYAKLENIGNYTTEANFNLTYNVTINFTKILGVNEIVVSVNGINHICNDVTIELAELSGKSAFSISKSGYGFTPSTFATTQNILQDIAIEKEYTISGRITTTNNHAASNVAVVVGSKKTLTNANGEYIISGLLGNSIPRVDMSVDDTAYNGEDFSFTATLGQFNSDASGVDYKVDETKYAYYLFKNGYQLLNTANSYQIYGNGSVHDTQSGEYQSVYIVYKKDGAGHRLIQNLNYYPTKIMGIVDPKVAQLTYVDLNTKKVKYQTLKEGSVGDGSASYTTSWTQENVSYQNYLESYGVNAEGYYPYVINESTIKSITEFGCSDGLYRFKITLDPENKIMYKDYVTQMGKMCSSQTFDGFISAVLTYTIDSNGYIHTMDIDEQYKVVAASIFKATVTDDFTYRFTTRSQDEVISNIDISSGSAIINSLKEETATKLNKAINSNFVVDMYYEKKRRVLV